MFVFNQSVVSFFLHTWVVVPLAPLMGPGCVCVCVSVRVCVCREPYERAHYKRCFGTALSAYIYMCTYLYVYIYITCILFLTKKTTIVKKNSNKQKSFEKQKIFPNCFSNVLQCGAVRCSAVQCGAMVSIGIHTRGCYGVASISRLLKIIGLFCRISSFIGLFCKRDLSI